MNISRIHHRLRISSFAIVFGILATLTMTATGAAQHPANPATVSKLDIVAALFDDILNGQDVNAAQDLISATAVIHTPYGEFTGPQGLRDYVGIIRRGYPDASFAVTTIDVEGDIVTVRWTMTATRYQIGPTEPVIDVNVDMPGESTITVAYGQVADLTQSQELAQTDHQHVT